MRSFNEIYADILKNEKEEFEMLKKIELNLF